MVVPTGRDCTVRGTGKGLCEAFKRTSAACEEVNDKAIGRLGVYGCWGRH
ncbi:hypothetical protein [Desulfovibrio sp. 86]|uniref:Uncharacterized protein n=1 Tax=uncultured Desulfovibrio sp. TaxID=167968 RepID=A0A212L658_9BACT|nr:hypothetical protein [Desulfovibrio sp. 86]SCM73062.1 hypothetical protein KL86DES1_21007 [uncultured Desulfovibrio sp.]VZH33908.1 conserved protein of unknown function [Desulfovibrio sp. 86]